MESRDQNKDIKKWMGMPMRWDPQNMFKNLWNPHDDRIFPPKYFGMGWSLNFHALLKKNGIIKGTTPKSPKK